MYERIVGLVKKSRPEHRRLCKSHYAYINRKIGMQKVLTRSLVPLVHSAPKTKAQITLLRPHHFLR